MDPVLFLDMSKKFKKNNLMIDHFCGVTKSFLIKCNVFFIRLNDSIIDFANKIYV